jgi:hypothetical protein
MSDKRIYGVVAAIVLLVITAGAAFFVIRSYVWSGESADSTAPVTDAPSIPVAIAATPPRILVLPDFSTMTPRFTSADFARDAVIMDKPNGKIASKAGVYFFESSPGTFWYWHRPWPHLNSNFACEAVGRVASGEHGTWSLYLSNLGTPHQGIRIMLHADATMEIGRSPVADPKFSEIQIEPFAHPAIKPGAEFNRLLVILRGQDLEVFVNGVSVCEPIHIQQHILPATISLSASAGPEEASRIEFTSCKVWWWKN